MGEKNKLDEVADGLQSIGNNMMGCGCLLTILVTIPVIIFLFIL